MVFRLHDISAVARGHVGVGVALGLGCATLFLSLGVGNLWKGGGDCEGQKTRGPPQGSKSSCWRHMLPYRSLFASLKLGAAMLTSQLVSLPLVYKRVCLNALTARGHWKLQGSCSLAQIYNKTASNLKLPNIERRKVIGNWQITVAIIDTPLV